MNINEKTFEKFKKIYNQYPSGTKCILAQNFMEFVDMLAPYADQEEDLNELTKYMFKKDFFIYQLFMNSILALGMRVKGLDSTCELEVNIWQ